MTENQSPEAVPCEEQALTIPKFREPYDVEENRVPYLRYRRARRASQSRGHSRRRARKHEVAESFQVVLPRPLRDI